MITENLSTLKIHKLSQEQYDRERAAGRLDEHALYITPDDGSSSGSGSSGGGVSSWNDLTDKPFYMESSEVVPLDGEFTTEYIDTYGVFGIDTAYNEELEAAPEKVTMVYDGVEYKDITFTDIPDLGKVGGNLYHMNALFGTSYENTGEPFILAVSKYGCAIMTLDTAETAHAIKLFIAGKSVEKINPSCLPDGLPYSETVMVDPTFDGDIAGREVVQIAENVYLVKVTTQYVSVSEVIGETMVVDYLGTETTITLTAETVLDGEATLGLPGTIITVEGNEAAFSVPTDTTLEGITITSGTWFMCAGDALIVKSLSCLVSGEQEVVHKIDMKCMPDGYPYSETIMVDPTFDGDMTGRETSKYADGLYFVKVTPQYVSIDEAIGATMVMDVGGEEQTSHLTEEMVMDLSLTLGVTGTFVGDGQVISVLEDITADGLTLTAGTWFLWAEGQAFVKSLSCLASGEQKAVHKMDMKYLPYSVALKSDLENIGAKMNANDPVGTGSFSMNRKANTTIGKYSHTDGRYNTASGDYSHAEGYETEASGDYSHAEGYETEASGFASHAEGYQTEVSGTYGSHAEGMNTTASGYASHAEGSNTKASGDYGSHAEGSNTKASGRSSHAEGYYAIASGMYSHAEGYHTEASGNSSHAEGKRTGAYGASSHAEGSGDKVWMYVTGDANTSVYTVNNIYTGTRIKDLIPGMRVRYTAPESDTRVSKIVAIDIVNNTITLDGTLSEEAIDNQTFWVYTGGLAFSECSHVEGNQNIATGRSQHVQGEYNIVDPEYDANDNSKRGKYAHIVGNGKSNDSRSNAHTLDWQGNAWYQGTVECAGVIIRSSTAGSTKKFRLTIDDSGTISATEVV